MVLVYFLEALQQSVELRLSQVVAVVLGDLVATHLLVQLAHAVSGGAAHISLRMLQTLDSELRGRDLLVVTEGIVLKHTVQQLVLGLELFGRKHGLLATLRFRLGRVRHIGRQVPKDGANAKLRMTCGAEKRVLS